MPNSTPVTFHAAACWRAVPIAALQTSDWGGSETGSESMSDDGELGGPGGGEAAVPIGMLHQSGIEAGSARRWSARACISALPIRRSSTMCPDAMYGAEKKQVRARVLVLRPGYTSPTPSGCRAEQVADHVELVIPAGGCLTARARTVLLNAGPVRSSCSGARSTFPFESSLKPRSLQARSTLSAP